MSSSTGRDTLVDRSFLQSWVRVQLVQHVGLFVVKGCENDVYDDVFDDLEPAQS